MCCCFSCQQKDPEAEVEAEVEVEAEADAEAAAAHEDGPDQILPAEGFTTCDRWGAVKVVYSLIFLFAKTVVPGIQIRFF